MIMYPKTKEEGVKMRLFRYLCEWLTEGKGGDVCPLSDKQQHTIKKLGEFESKPVSIRRVKGGVFELDFGDEQ